MNKFRYANMNIVVRGLKEEKRFVKLLEACNPRYKWSDQDYTKDFLGINPTNDMDIVYYMDTKWNGYKKGVAGYDVFKNVSIPIKFIYFSDAEEMDDEQFELWKKLQ